MELQSEVSLLSRETDNASLDSKSPHPSRIQQVMCEACIIKLPIRWSVQAQAELDDLIASECVFCGDIMVRDIDKPFIDDQDFDRVMSEWL